LLSWEVYFDEPLHTVLLFNHVNLTLHQEAENRKICSLGKDFGNLSSKLQVSGYKRKAGWQKH